MSKSDSYRQLNTGRKYLRRWTSFVTAVLTAVLLLTSAIPAQASERIYGETEAVETGTSESGTVESGTVETEAAAAETSAVSSGETQQNQSSYNTAEVTIGTAATLAAEESTTAVQESSAADESGSAQELTDPEASQRIYGETEESSEAAYEAVRIDYQTPVGRQNLTISDAASTEAQIYLYLIRAGFTPAAAAGVMGNIQRESDFDPTSGSEDAAFGLFQMMGSLQAQQKEYCEKNNLDFYSTNGQMKSMIDSIASQLFDKYTGNGYVYNWEIHSKVYGTDEHMYEAYYCWLSQSMSLEQYKKLTDPQYAAEIWRRVVERNTGSAADIEKRGNYAQAYYDKYKNFDGSGSDIIADAVRYVGNPYVWGGNSLTNGIDCSHFVCAILRETGHYSEGYRTSKALRTAGMTVNGLANAQPGDVLCYEGHVAFYMGPNTIVHAAGRKVGIVISRNVDIQNFHGGLITIRRFR